MKRQHPRSGARYIVMVGRHVLGQPVDTLAEASYVRDWWNDRKIGPAAVVFERDVAGLERVA